MSESIIRISHLNKTFGTGDGAVRALEDISLDVRPGEIFGIIGLSGAGKSTLVRCMNLLERPTSGSVIVDGAEITALSDRDLRRARQSISMLGADGLDILQLDAHPNGPPALQCAAEVTLCHSLGAGHNLEGIDYHRAMRRRHLSEEAPGLPVEVAIAVQVVVRVIDAQNLHLAAFELIDCHCLKHIGKQIFHLRGRLPELIGSHGL